MSYSRNTLELIYEDFAWATDAPAGMSNLAASFTLVYPRPNLATRSTTKEISLPAADPAETTATFADRLLFKETVQGPFGMIVELSPGDTRHPLTNLLAGLIKEGSDAAGRMVADPFAVALRPLLRSPFRFFGQFSNNLPLAAGQVDLKSGKTKKAKELAIPLYAERPWPLPSRPRRGKSNAPRRRQSLFQTGDLLGSIRLTYRIV